MTWRFLEEWELIDVGNADMHRRELTDEDEMDGWMEGSIGDG